MPLPLIRDAYGSLWPLDGEMTTVVLDTTITCPECVFAKTETMPTNGCHFFYTCSSCGMLLRPLPGDCC